MKISSNSETNKSLSFAESLDGSKDCSEDWRVIESEIRPYCKELITDISQNEGSDPDDHEEERDLDGLTPVILEARYKGTVLLDSWYVKLFEQVPFLHTLLYLK